MPRRRRQLSLYLPPPEAEQIEAVRRIADPVQHRLIPAHVTLCREDELDAVTQLASHVREQDCASVTLTFGSPERFMGHGLLLPCIDGLSAFQELRQRILGIDNARPFAPHMTLAHPRNPPAVADALSLASDLAPPLTFRLTQLHLIEQCNDDPWKILDTFALRV